MASVAISFGPFQLDLHRRELRRAGQPVRLGGRPLDILCELALAEGGIVSKDDLLDRLWAGRVVEEGNVHVHVSALRKALDDRGDGHSYIVTIPGRGYRLAVQQHGTQARPNEPSVIRTTAQSARPALTPVADELRTISRRQLTLISCELMHAADLADRLDPEDLRTLMVAFHQYWRETVARFGGAVTRPAGGELLAYFGYPHASEHDAEQAVRAARALIDEAGRLGAAAAMVPLRLGIATGAVVLDVLLDSGTPDRESLVGEPLDQAAALRRQAQPGMVLVAASTRRLVGDLFEFRRIAGHPSDSSGASADAFEVLRSSALPSRFEALHGAALTPLVGREEEFDLLRRRWEQIQPGGLRVLLLCGEPGIGKSRLTVELQRSIRNERHICLRYFCSPHHPDSALHPVIRQIEGAAGFQGNDGAATRLAKLRSLVAQAGTPDDDLELLADMLSLPCGAGAAEVTPRRKREMTFEALIRQIDAAAQRGPVLLVFEDVHWSDPTTLEWIDLVIHRLPARPVLLLVTFRPEFAAPWSGQPHVTSLMLHRLGQGESAALVRAAIGVDTLSTDVVAEIAERADGIPLFLEELGRALAESVDGGAGEAIPPTLQASLMERFDRLDATTQQVAQVGAVIGREFSRELVAAACEQPDALVDAALQSLVASGLAFRRGTAPNPVFIFKHGLVLDAIYASLLRSRRQQLHARIAEALERIAPEALVQHPELLGQHFTQAGQPDRAMRYWRLAVERALRTNAYQEAVGQCMRGLRAIESLAARDQRLHEEAWLQLQRGIALTARLGPSAPQMLDAFSRAGEIAGQLGDDHLLASALLGLWAHHNARALLRPALALTRRLFAIGEAGGNQALCVQAHAASLTVTYKMGAFDEAWQHFEAGTALYRPGMEVIEAIPNYSRPGPDMLLHGSFVAWVMGYPDRSRDLARATLAAAREMNQPYTITHCTYMLGHLAELQADWPAVRQSNHETVELATRWGFSGTLQLVERRIALVAVAIDRDEEQLRFKCEHRQPGFARSLHDVVLARTWASRGRPERGLGLLDDTLEYSRQTGSCFYDAEVHRARGHLLALLGRRQDAERSYLAAVGLAKRQHARMWELRAATDLAAFWLAAGDRRRACGLLGPLLAWFVEGREVPELQAARAVLASASGPGPGAAPRG